jgi:cysteine desulfurase
VTGAPRAPHIASLAFPGLPAEPLLHALEARGVLASAGSACASKTAGPSPTLKAVGIDDRTAVLRFSFSRLSRPADADAAVAALVEAAAELASGRARR